MVFQMQKKHNGTVYLMEVIVFLKKGKVMQCILISLTNLMSLTQFEALSWSSSNIMQICGYYISQNECSEREPRSVERK